MALVKTFRINPEYGVPDRDIREWLNQAEEKQIVRVQTCYIPPIGEADPRITVIVTKLDDLHDITVKTELDGRQIAESVIREIPRIVNESSGAHTP